MINISNCDTMKTTIITILLCLSFFSISSIADEPTVGIGTLVLSCDSVSVGDIFNVTLYIDTGTDTTTGFTIRQLNWSSDLASMLVNYPIILSNLSPYNGQSDVDISLNEISSLIQYSDKGKNATFSETWYDEVFNDDGNLNVSEGNLTYLIANKLSGVTGNNTAVTFTFQALAPGELEISIPSTIWSGQAGFVVDLMDDTIWHNTTVTILPEEYDGQDSLNWSIETIPNIGSSHGNGTGIITCPVSGLSYDTVYTWYVNATDGKSWTNKTYQFTTEEKDSGSPPNDPPNNPPNDPPDEPDENELPVPVINISGNQTVNETIAFNASASTDDGEIVNYSWNFGDNTTAFGIVVTHSYNQSGNYTVTLSITDDEDATATTTANVSIKNQTSPPDEPPDDDSPDDDDTTPPDDDDDTTPNPTIQDTDYTLLIIGIIIIVVIVAVGYIIWEWFM